MPAKKFPPASKPVEPIAPPVVPVVPLPAQQPPAPVTPYAPPQPLSPGDERTWAMLAHLSVLISLLTAVGGPVAALVIYLVYKDRSRFVAYHALQAMIFQLIWWFGSGILIGVMWAVVGVLCIVLIGVVLVPVAALLTPVILLMPLVALIYGIVGAVQTSQGQDFKYWLVGDWVRGTLTGE